ncbi:MAG: hypothetical protein ACE5H2_05840 [Terriglobia bacterium]
MKLKFYLCRACMVALVGGLPATQEVRGAELQPQTVAAWETYVRLTEQRITAELDEGQRFLVTDFMSASESQRVRALLKRGGVYIRKMEIRDEEGRKMKVAAGMIHHWIGCIFVPDVSLSSVLDWVQDYDHHHRYFKEVERSKLLSREGDRFKIFFRLRRTKIITVFYNTDHTAIYRHRDARRVSSRSFTTKIAQLENPGTSAEKEKPVGNDSGFLWRLNSYWRFQEEKGGVLVECESISLSRAMPLGLGWLIKSFVESVPRESLQNTLVSIREGINKKVGSGVPDRD